MKASSESGLWAMRMVVRVRVSVMAREGIRIGDTLTLGGVGFAVHPGGRNRGPETGLDGEALYFQSFPEMARPLNTPPASRRGAMFPSPRPFQIQPRRLRP